MIVRNRPSWFGMLFVWRGSVLPVIALQLLFTMGFAVVVTLLHGRLFHWKVPLNFVPFSLIGLTLAIFLGFRNSTSYARFWEARTHWGIVLSESRSLLRQALTLTCSSPAEIKVFAGRLIAFSHALRHQLRRSSPADDFKRLLMVEDRKRLAGTQFAAAIVLLLIGEWVRDRRQTGQLDPQLVQAMELPLCRLTTALGGCERIANTPIPFTYAVIIHRTIFVYCMLLPFGLVDTIGTMTPVIVTFVAYTFFALDALAAEIEDPFGIEPNDLALDAATVTIESTLREMIGEVMEPEATVTEKFVST